MNNWKILPLSKLTNNFDSKRIPVKESLRKKGPYPYYGASGIVDYIDDFLFEGEYVLVAEDGENLKTRKSPIACIAKGKFWVNNHAHILQGNEKSDTRFLMYFLKNSDISGFLSGSTMPKLTQENLGRIPVLSPPLPKQRAIAHILGTLDDKIELNRRMNETLEAMARALFKSWFVDFDPVRAKVEGRDTGLPKEIADLFPDGFEKSELGEIPRGWSIGKLGDLIVQRVERTTPGVETRSLPYVPIECITSKNIFLSQSLSGQEAHSSLVKFYKGDILFGAMRPYFHKVCVAPFDGTTRTTAFVLIPKEQGDQYFSLFSLFQEETIEFATNHSEGSTIPYAKWIGSLETKETVIPPRSLRNSFQNVAAGFIEAGINQVNESISILQIRDIILPKLLSGEISVTDYISSVDRGPLEARCNQDSDCLKVPNVTTRRAMEEAEEIVRTKRARRET